MGSKRTSSERKKGENGGAIKSFYTQVGVASAKLVGGARRGRLEGRRLFEFVSKNNNRNI